MKEKIKALEIKNSILMKIIDLLTEDIMFWTHPFHDKEKQILDLKKNITLQKMVDNNSFAA